MKLNFLDFETYYDKDYSLSKLTTEQYIRDPRFQVIGFSYAFDDDQPEWVTGSDEYIASRLYSLKLEECAQAAHNNVFDASILAFRYNIHPKFLIDTLSMARPLNDVTKGGSLKHLAEVYGIGAKGDEVIHALGKRREDFSPSEMARYGSYCSNDTNILRLLYHILKQYSTPQEMYIIDMMLRMFTDPTIVLNRALLEAHLKDVIARKEALMAKITGVAERDVLMSNPQFAQLLESMGVTPPMKVSKTTGKTTYAFAKTDEGFRNLLEHEDEAVQAVAAARLGVKTTLEETRTFNFIQLTYRGALPILLHYYGAHTGRASGGDKLNLQNLPRGGKLRQSMQAPYGHSMVACDSAQIEARVTAWLAGQTDLVADFAAGADIYSKFASVVYGRPINRKRKEIDADGKEFSPDFKEGFVGKTCILGLGFGMGAERFHDTLKTGQGGMRLTVPIGECERIVEIYRGQYDRIPDLWEQAKQAIKAMSRGEEFYLGVGIQLKCDKEGVHLPNGMVQRYPGLAYYKADGEKYKRDGYYYQSRKGPNFIHGPKLVENIVQALARIVVFHQMAKIKKNLDKYDRKFGYSQRFKVVLTVHDEVVAICPDKYVAKVKELMERIMATPPKWGPDLPIACEAGSGKNYGECK